MYQSLTSPFALYRLWHRSNPVSLTLGGHPHYVIARADAQMLARQISHSGLAVTMTVTLAIADEEINDVLIAVVAVSDSVLTQKARRLNEEVARFGAFGGFG